MPTAVPKPDSMCPMGPRGGASHLGLGRQYGPNVDAGGLEERVLGCHGPGACGLEATGNGQDLQKALLAHRVQQPHLHKRWCVRGAGQGCA